MNFLTSIKKTGAIILVAALVLTTLSSCKKPTNGGSSLVNSGDGKLNLSLGEDKWDYKQEVVKAANLEETGDAQNRYLTIPNSRLVLNPYAFESLARDVSQVKYSNSSRMPVNIGYCDPHFNEGRGIELANVGLFAEGTSSAGSKAKLLWQAELGNPSVWRASGEKGKDHDVSFSNEKIDLSVVPTAEVAWQHVESATIVDLTNAYLTVTINSTEGGNFAIKVNRGNGVDTTIIETKTTGTYTFDLQEATGWTGVTNLTVKVFSVTKGSKISFSNLKIESAEKIYSDASSSATSWRPDLLGFEASYPEGTKITGKDFFYDEKTIVRNFKAENSKSFLIYGEFNGNASLDDNTILVKRDTFKYAISFSEDIKPLFYSSLVEVISDSNANNTPPSGIYGVWAFKIDSSQVKEMSISFAFDHKDVEDSKVIEYSRAVKGDVSSDIENRTKAWNELLEKVPRPSNFELTGIDTMGMTPEMVKHSYYVAWVQSIGNLLPPNPEIGYNYPSLAAGKSSLWAYGSPECAYSPIWEALYNTQLYAQIDPDTAWDLLVGFHSLVDDEGVIAGESLPPNNARVAWNLHTVKPNLEALKEIQPQLDRHLKWRFENPRWIYLDVTPDKTLKDTAFVSAALLDVRFLMKINDELGLSDQNAEWERKIKNLYNSMKMWFFSKTQKYPAEYYSVATGARSEGHQLWVLQSLHIPYIQESEVNQLVKMYEDRFNERSAFGGMGGIKYEAFVFSLLGLYENGHPDAGRNLLQVGLRDITRSGIHSEGYNYDQNEQNPLPEGVRPSLFGAAMMIEMVYIHNGVRFDDGMPVFANYVSNEGGIENWSLYGGTFNVSKSGNSYSYGGSTIGENKTADVTENDIKMVFEGTNVQPLH